MSKAKCPKNGLFGKCSPFFGKGAMPATFGRAVLVSWLCLRPSSKELRRSSMYSLLLVHTLRSSGTSKGASLITFVGAALTRSFLGYLVRNLRPLGYNNEPPARSNRSTWKKNTANHSPLTSGRIQSDIKSPAKAGPFTMGVVPLINGHRNSQGVLSEKEKSRGGVSFWRHCISL